jgi:hypothetical protein
MTTQQAPRAFSLFPVLLSAAKGASLTMLTGIVGALIAVSPSPVDAALLEGETVATTNFHGSQPDSTTPIGPLNRVVGAGIELTNFGFSDFVDIDFSDTSILITLKIDQLPAFFESLRFFDVNGTIPAFTGVTLNSATTWIGFGASRIDFTSDRIDLNLTALAGLQGQQISLNLNGGGNGNGNGKVSEPASYLLASIALLSMLGVMSRRRKKAAYRQCDSPH